MLKVVGIRQHLTLTAENGISVNTYAYEEIFAEKKRALVKRARARDLYDVIFIKNIQPNQEVLLKVLKRKCEFKNTPLPFIFYL